MPAQSVMLDQVQRYFEYPGADVDRARELYHDDAVLEFPQSGERFEGVANFTEWRRRYPAEVRYRMRRITAREDLVVVELSISYNGGPWQYGVQLLEFRGDRVARERIYVMEGWEAPEWRASWRFGYSGGPAGVTEALLAEWRCRESNPGPSTFLQGFSGRSLQSPLLGSGDLAGKFTVTSPVAYMSPPVPRPYRRVSLLADADHRVGSIPGSTDFFTPP